MQHLANGGMALGYFWNFTTVSSCSELRHPVLPVQVCLFCCASVTVLLSCGLHVNPNGLQLYHGEHACVYLHLSANFIVLRPW